MSEGSAISRQRDMTSPHRLEVAINIGVADSAVAWWDTEKPEEISIINQWPNSNRNSDRVPSEISYTPTGELHKWGFAIKPSEERLCPFLLLFDPSNVAFGSDPTLNRGLSSILRTKKPVDVVADYISCLREHIIVTLRRSYGPRFIAETPIDYILSVPSTCSYTTKKNLLHAAESGLGDNKIKFISEPEAAVAWVFLRGLTPSNSKLHDITVTVNCGSDTIDLISYEILSFNSTPLIKEHCIRTGGLCGSTSIDRRFEDFIKSRIGATFDKISAAGRNRMLQVFHDLKFVFTDSMEDNMFMCPAPGLPDDISSGVEDGEFIFTREDMKNIFDPVINEIISLINGQIDMTEAQDQRGLGVSSVLLIGGFGQTPYLRKRLEADLKNKTGRDDRSQIEIIQPTNAYTIFARGALLAGATSLSRSLISKRYYGIDSEMDFTFGKDSPENLLYCQYTGKALCRHRITWFIKQGDEVLENDPIIIPIHRRVGFDSNDTMIFTNDVLSWEQQGVPEYSNQSINRIEKLCTIVSDLSMVPKGLFTKTTGPKVAPHYEVNYDLALSVESDTLTVKTMFRGAEYGSVTAEYLHE